MGLMGHQLPNLGLGKGLRIWALNILSWVPNKALFRILGSEWDLGKEVGILDNPEFSYWVHY